MENVGDALSESDMRAIIYFLHVETHGTSMDTAV